MSRSVMRVGLTYDLRDAYLQAGYSEIETAELDRIDTIDSIEKALCNLGYVVERIGHLKQLAARLVAGDRWDLVFNICEGMHGIGREAQVPALLDAYQIPYVFSDTMVCALTLHKGMTKDVVRAAGVATPGN
jgi:D-alanine-D-alanine ligase